MAFSVSSSPTSLLGNIVRRPELLNLEQDARLEDLQPVNTRTLRFVDPELEQRYDEWDLRGSETRFRRVSGLGVLIGGYAVFVEFGQISATARMLSIAVWFSALLTLCFLYTKFYKRRVVRLLPRLAFYIVLGTLLLTLTFRLDKKTERPSSAVGLVILLAFAFNRIGFLRTAVHVGVILLIFLVSSLVVLDVKWALLSVANPVLFSAALFAGSYFSYYQSRRTFVLLKMITAESVALRLEKQKTDRLLLSLFPASVAVVLRERLAKTIEEGHASGPLFGSGETISMSVESGSIAFVRVHGFDEFAKTCATHEALFLLDQIFKRFDAVVRRRGVEKVKTIGSVYMIASGVPEPYARHAQRLLKVCIELVGIMHHINESWETMFPNISPLETKLALRIGVNSGSIFGGVLGVDSSTPFFDVLGDTVNLAARLETNGHPDRIQVSSETADLCESDFNFSMPHTLKIKGKGKVNALFVESAKPAGPRSSTGPMLPGQASNSNDMATAEVKTAVLSSVRDVPSDQEKQVGQVNWRHNFVDPKYESEYRSDGHFVGSMEGLRFFTQAMIFVFLVNGINDAYVTEYDLFLTAALMRYGGIVPLYLLALGFSYVSPILFFRRARTVYMTIFVTASLLMALRLHLFYAEALDAAGSEYWSDDDVHKPAAEPLYWIELYTHISAVVMFPAWLFVDVVVVLLLTFFMAVAVGVVNGVLGPLMVSFVLWTVYYVVLGLVSFAARDTQTRRNFALMLRLREQADRVAMSHSKTAVLLLTVLPAEIITRLQDNPGQPIADYVPQLGFMQLDIVGFTAYSATQTPATLVETLSEIFAALDRACLEHSARKIKMVGDAAMVVSVPSEDPDAPPGEFVSQLILVAHATHRSFEAICAGRGAPLKLRIGISVGPAIAGVIGSHRLCYDVWGVAPERGQALEAACRPGGTLVDIEVRELVDEFFEFEEWQTPLYERPCYHVVGEKETIASFGARTRVARY